MSPLGGRLTRRLVDRVFIRECRWDPHVWAEGKEVGCAGRRAVMQAPQRPQPAPRGALETQPSDPAQLRQSEMEGKKDPGEASTCRPL